MQVDRRFTSPNPSFKDHETGFSPSFINKATTTVQYNKRAKAQTRKEYAGATAQTDPNKQNQRSIQLREEYNSTARRRRHHARHSQEILNHAIQPFLVPLSTERVPLSGDVSQGDHVIVRNVLRQPLFIGKNYPPLPSLGSLVI